MSEELDKIHDFLMDRINEHYTGEPTKESSRNIAIQYMQSAISRVSKHYKSQLEACRKERDAYGVVLHQTERQRTADIAELSSKLTTALEALRFYADTNNDELKYVEFTDPDLNDPEIGNFVRSDDFEYISDQLSFIHGKRARKAIAEIEGKSTYE